MITFLSNHDHVYMTYDCVGIYVRYHSVTHLNPDFMKSFILKWIFSQSLQLNSFIAYKWHWAGLLWISLHSVSFLQSSCIGYTGKACLRLAIGYNGP